MDREDVFTPASRRTSPILYTSAAASSWPFLISKLVVKLPQFGHDLVGEQPHVPFTFILSHTAVKERSCGVKWTSDFHPPAVFVDDLVRRPDSGLRIDVGHCRRFHTGVAKRLGPSSVRL